MLGRFHWLVDLLAVMPSGQAVDWEHPLPGYRQIGCYGEPAAAAAHAASLAGRGIEARVIEKATAGCHAVLIPDTRLPTLTYQVGAFAELANAELVASSVAACGFQTETVPLTDGQRTLYRVRVHVSTEASQREQLRRCLETNPFIPDAAMAVPE